MSNETTIVDEIRARYVRDPRLRHPTEVAVSERNGTVTLRGTVDSFRQRHAAVEIAKSVRGVRAIQDQLFVDPRDHWEDEELKGAALQALISSSDALAEKIEVRVSAGWVTLSGQVKHQQDSNAAFEAVSRLPRVGGITNKIRVVTAGGW
jgi:osmotically-inducible protein OsmY